MSKPITQTPANTVEAVLAETMPAWRKILVRLDDALEDIRWNKVVHIRTVRRLPKIHSDGRVTIRHLGNDIEVRATKNSFDQDTFYYTFKA